MNDAKIKFVAKTVIFETFSSMLQLMKKTEVPLFIYLFILFLHDSNSMVRIVCWPNLVTFA